MKISHHPHDETLAFYTGGSLAAGPALVVSAHLSVCTQCRERMADFKALAGLMLQNLPPARLDGASLPQTLARIDQQERLEVNASPKALPFNLPGGIDLPDSLKAQKIGSWHYLPPSLHWSRVGLYDAENMNVVLLQIGAGTKVPRHGHSGTEYTLVLAGAFYDENGHYLPGDLIEADDAIDHQPIVDSSSDCLCVAAVAGKLRFHSVLGRMMQPLIGI